MQRQLRLLYAPQQLDAERAVYALAILLSIIASVRVLTELIELADLDRELTAAKRDATDATSVTHAERKTRLGPLLDLEQRLRAALGVANAGPSTDSFRAHALGLDSDAYLGAEQADSDLIVLPSRIRGGLGKPESVPIECVDQARRSQLTVAARASSFRPSPRSRTTSPFCSPKRSDSAWSRARATPTRTRSTSATEPRCASLPT